MPAYSPGFRTRESECEELELSVEGELPTWLSGSLVRNGPGKFEVGGERVAHWFDGLAMLRKFRFADDEVTYSNRFLRTETYRKAVEEGELVADPTTAAFFFFHTVNAFETEEAVVVDLGAYDDAAIVDNLFMSAMDEDGANPVEGDEQNPELEATDGTLTRFRVPLDGSGSAVERKVLYQGMELPRVAPTARMGAYRYAYGQATARGPERTGEGDRRDRRGSRVVGGWLLRWRAYLRSASRPARRR